MRVCDVYIEEHFLYNKTLTYTCEGFNLSKGIRVIVHVKNRKMVGFVDRVYEAHLDEYEFELKPILSIRWLIRRYRPSLAAYKRFYLINLDRLVPVRNLSSSAY